MRRSGNDYFYHADDQYSVMALTDAMGAVVERYAYDDYGTLSFFDAAGVGAIVDDRSFSNQRVGCTDDPRDTEVVWWIGDAGDAIVGVIRSRPVAVFAPLDAPPADIAVRCDGAAAV